jgi:hypothetical protein
VAGTGRLRGSSTGTSDSYMASLDTTIYDEAGNRTWYYDSHGVSTPYPDNSGTSQISSTSPATYVEWMRSWYGADDKLRFVDRRTCYVFKPDGAMFAACNPHKEPMPNERPAFEEYRYDALGRRVLVRSRQHFACTTRCQSVVRRIIWDGDQVLAEVQAPGYSYGPADMERDTGFKVAATSGVTGDPLDAPAGTSVTYPGFYFGRVIYTHGPGIDHPLSITRMEYSDSLPGPITVYPHENWKGAFDLGSYDAGSLNAPCKLLHSSGMTTPFQVYTPGSDSTTTTTTTDTTSHCLKVDWPAPHLWLTNRIRENGQVGAESWNGSLIDEMRDATGQMYMRNGERMERLSAPR